MKADLAMLNRKKAKYSMIVWSLTYLFLFPFLFFFFAPFMKINSINSTCTGKILGPVGLFPIFSMPLSLFLMWFSYSKGCYSITRLCWIIPILFFICSLLMHSMVK
jgi:hypothetical protein